MYTFFFLKFCLDQGPFCGATADRILYHNWKMYFSSFTSGGVCFEKIAGKIFCAICSVWCKKVCELKGPSHKFSINAAIYWLIRSIFNCDTKSHLIAPVLDFVCPSSWKVLDTCQQNTDSSLSLPFFVCGRGMILPLWIVMISNIRTLRSCFRVKFIRLSFFALCVWFNALQYYFVMLNRFGLLSPKKFHYLDF